jgi:hypothetical protein
MKCRLLYRVLRKPLFGRSSESPVTGAEVLSFCSVSRPADRSVLQER